MKKTVKILVPIFLALLILATIIWYGFVYDRDFSRDMMLKHARLFSDHGNQAIASWFYDLAYEFSAQDDAVAIELANQFKDEGNYTKAEYTLSKAIADGGTLDLYIALCRTYVEQDKLLDAVTMLDNVADKKMKAHLDAIRPAVPSADPIPGFYSQYISVELKADQGTIYFTTDGEYPSIDNVPYSEPFTLPGGETAVQAITVADNGLVSPLCTLGYTVGGVIEPVVFDDPAMEEAIRNILNVSDDVIYTNQLWTIMDFTVPASAQVLTDLNKLTYLQTLTINGYSLDSLQVLSPLVYLTHLNLNGCRFPAVDLNILASLPMLEELSLANCGLSTLAGLEQATNLMVLNLANNTVRNLDPISSLGRMKEINLQHNAVTSLSALSTLTNLEVLDVSFNSVNSISAISSCTKLRELNIGNNKIGSLSGIEALESLNYLFASANQIADISPVAACLELKELYVANNQLTDVTALGVLSKLETLDISYNQCEELPAFPDDAMLRTIDGSYNAITSLKPLRNQMNLSQVFMDYNRITDIGVLENCYNLVMINVYGNAVSGVDKLTAHDIIVNYDPTITTDD